MYVYIFYITLLLAKNTMATATASATAKTVEKFFFFWKSKSPFSQWHKAEFVVDDVEFNCAEQYMMYRKASEWISVGCVPLGISGISRTPPTSFYYLVI